MMMNPINGLLALLALQMAASAAAGEQAESPPADIAAIRAVAAAFRAAILNKDEAGFMALFVAGPLVWQSVDSDATRAAAGLPGRDPVERSPEKNPAILHPPDCRPPRQHR
jgi:hypothetical protein